ncbi:hypothetical protein AB4Y72_16560 [Arthrobacter sp. YAF34]|uniref:hypothetical protein n=1 Tax=Arthrobacter sp. YAF34 TaxID=3233083 RepID=UPI003F91AC6F
MVSALNRRLARETVHSSLLPSACSVEEVAMHNRLDPYWDQLWAPGSQASWASIRTARTHKNNGWGRVNAKLLPNHKEATRLLTSNRRRADRLATWGVLNSWTAVSAEQLAAFTGSRYVLDPRGSTIAASFAVDLLDIGMFPNPLAAIPNPDRNYLYRAARSDAFEKHIVPTLTWPEWASVTGGLGWASGGQYDRHNLLAAELCLRVAEYLPIGAILGEKFSTVDLLAGSGLGRTVKMPDNRRADGTIVRSDGMRIALELTATTSRGLESKVRRWARLLTERSLETSGLTVLFVAAPHPDRKFGGGNDPRRGIYETVRGVLKEFPGRGPDSAAARIGVTSWEDWFPGQHQLSERFFHLEADFMVGPGPGPERWTTRRMLTDYTFEPWHTFDATAVVDNAPILAATPHWMRTGDRTHLIGTPADRAAVRVPHPAPVRPHLAKGRPLGAGTGGAGDSKLPVRLRLVW